MSECILHQLKVGRIPGYPNYRVLSSGSVWHRYHSKGKWKRKATQRDRYGYWKLGISAMNRNRKIYLHTAVLMAFVGPRPPGLQCRHLDGNKANNRLENLCWGTASENAEDAKRHGTSPRKLTECDVRGIRQRVKYGKWGIRTRLAKEYGVSIGQVCRIAKGQRWKTLGEHGKG